MSNGQQQVSQKQTSSLYKKYGLETDEEIVPVENLEEQNNQQVLSNKKISNLYSKYGVKPASPVVKQKNTFDKDTFNQNISEITTELKQALSKQYGTDNVQVIANSNKRSIADQIKNVEKGASKSAISLHNFEAAADFQIKINDKLITATGRDDSLEESTDPYRILGGLARKKGLFWGWNWDSGHVGQTRFVHQFIDQNPSMAFTDEAKAFYELNKESAPNSAKQLLESLDKLYNKTSNREYFGKELSENTLLEPIYTDSLNTFFNTVESNQKNKNETEIAFENELNRINAGNSNIDENSSQWTQNISPKFTSSPFYNDTDLDTKKPFDPEGNGYNMDFAVEAGMEPDSSGHWSSREPKTGRILKGRNHPTFNKTIKGEIDAGYEVYKGTDGNYYSREKDEEDKTNPFAGHPILHGINDYVNWNKETENPEDSDSNFFEQTRSWWDSNVKQPIVAYNKKTRKYEAPSYKLSFIKTGTGPIFTITPRYGDVDVVDSFNKFETLVRTKLQDETGEQTNLNEGIANLAVDAASVPYAIGTIANEAGKFVFEADTEAGKNFTKSVLGMLASVVPETMNFSNDFVTALGINPLRPFGSEEHNKAVMRFWRNPVNSALFAVGYKYVPPANTALKNALAKKMIDVEKARTIQKQGKPVKIEPEIAELVKALDENPKVAKALDDVIQENKQIEINFLDDNNLNIKPKNRKKTDPQDVLPLDTPIETVIAKKGTPTKKQIQKNQQKETGRISQQREKFLIEEYEMMIKNIATLEAKLQSQNLSGGQIANINNSLKRAKSIVKKNLDEQQLRKMDTIQYMEMSFGGLTKSQMNWVKNRLKKGKDLTTAKFAKFLRTSNLKMPVKPSIYWNDRTQRYSRKLDFQDTQLDATLNLFKPNLWDKSLERILDINHTAKKIINNSGTNIKLAKEAVDNLNLIKGATGAAQKEFDNIYNQVIGGYIFGPKKLTSADSKELNRYIQTRRELAIYQNNKDKIVRKLKELEDLKKQPKTAETKQKTKELKSEIKKTQDYDYALQAEISEKYGKPVIGKNGKYKVDDVYEHLSDMQNYVKYIEDVNPRVAKRAEIVFNQYRKNLEDLNKAGVYDDVTTDLWMLYDYQRKNYLNKQGKTNAIRGLGGKVINSTDEYGKSLKGGGILGIDNNWARNMHDALRMKNSMIFENNANLSLAKIADDIPQNGFVKKIKSFENIPQNFRRIQYIDNGVKKELSLDKNFYDSWIKADPQMTSNTVKMLQFFSGKTIVQMMATGYNPKFVFTNMPRDIMYNFFRTDQYSAKLPVYLKDLTIDYIETARDAWLRGKGSAWEDYILEGGQMSYLTSQGQIFGKTGYVSSPVQRGINMFNTALGYIGESSEVWTRLAVRNRAIKGGMPSKEATAYARDIMDFGTGGSAVKAANNVVPYLSAGVTATRGMVESARKNPKLFAIKSAQISAAAGAVWFYNKHYGVTEEYRMQVPEYEEFDNWIVFLPGEPIDTQDGKKEKIYLKVPMDDVTKVVVHGTNLLLESAFGNPEKAESMKKEYMKNVIGTLSPVDMTTHISPTLGVSIGFMYNKNSYTGYDLHSVDKNADNKVKINFEEDEYIRDLADYINESTGPGKYNISPAQLDNMSKELAMKNNFYVELGNEVYKQTKLKNGQNLKSYKNDKSYSEKFWKRFFGKTKGTSQQVYNIVKEDIKDVATLKEENTQAVDYMLNLYFQTKKDVEKNKGRYLDIAKEDGTTERQFVEYKTYNVQEEFDNWIENITDPIEKERLLIKFQRGLLNEEYTTVSEWLVKRGMNWRPQNKALVLFAEVENNHQSEDYKDKLWQELIVNGFITDETMLYYSSYLAISKSETGEMTATTPAAEWYKETYGEDAYSRLVDRVLRVKELGK